MKYSHTVWTRLDFLGLRRAITDFDCLDTCPSHGRMARGGHGLPKVSLGPAMPNLSMPCGQATTEKALQPLQGWPAYKVSWLRPFSTPLDIPRRTPMVPVKTPSNQIVVRRFFWDKLIHLFRFKMPYVLSAAHFVFRSNLYRTN
jgi:hypothetical protein